MIEADTADANGNTAGCEPGGARLMFVVSRRDLDRYDYLRGTFRDEARVNVVLDRRRSERRWRDVEPGTERRHGQRRKLDTNESLRSLGWAMIREHVQEPQAAHEPGVGQE